MTFYELAIALGSDPFQILLIGVVLFWGIPNVIEEWRGPTRTKSEEVTGDVVLARSNVSARSNGDRDSTPLAA